MPSGIYPRKSLADRLWGKVKKTDTCWLWQGAVNNYGYAHLTVEHKTVYAHRLFYQLLIGGIPAGKLLCHHCDNPKCVNPSHMFIGTQSDNMKDCFDKGRIIPPKIPQYGKNNGASKLTEEQVKTIRHLSAWGLSSLTIANSFGVSKSQVRNIILRRNWK